MVRHYLSRTALFLFLCAVVFVLSRQSGRVVNVPAADPSANRDVPTSGGLELHELPNAAAKLGVRLVPGAEPNSVMFVHPQSRSWFEVPLPPPTASPTNVASQPHGFMGPDACASCHRQQYEGFLKTAHYAASSLPTAGTMLGSYKPGSNRMSTVSPDLDFEMEQDAYGNFFQNVHLGGLKKRIGIDLVTGSGHIGQTYLFWRSNALYQLHVSYLRETDDWINSPGYYDGTAWYSRTVIPKCVECHTTYAEWIPGTENQYVRDSFILGVTCERCHGPGQTHVQYHRDHPTDKQARHITNPARLSREQTNDVCAQCHFGLGDRKSGVPFSFRPGDKLSDHWRFAPKSESMEGGVHSSNQLARLSLSKCFSKSASMTCNDCHRTHQDDRKNIKLFSEKCVQCHAPEHCGASEQVGVSIGENCIDCHMAMGQDTHLAVKRNETTEFPLLRDHYIRILPAATERYLGK